MAKYISHFNCKKCSKYFDAIDREKCPNNEKVMGMCVNAKPYIIKNVRALTIDCYCHNYKKGNN